MLHLLSRLMDDGKRRFWDLERASRRRDERGPSGASVRREPSSDDRARGTGDDAPCGGSGQRVGADAYIVTQGPNSAGMDGAAECFALLGGEPLTAGRPLSYNVSHTREFAGARADRRRGVFR